MTAASAARWTRPPTGPRGCRSASRYSRWSPTQTESRPMRSAAVAMARSLGPAHDALDLGKLDPHLERPVTDRLCHPGRGRYQCRPGRTPDPLAGEPFSFLSRADGIHRDPLPRRAGDAAAREVCGALYGPASTAPILPPHSSSWPAPPAISSAATSVAAHLESVPRSKVTVRTPRLLLHQWRPGDGTPCTAPTAFRGHRWHGRPEALSLEESAYSARPHVDCPLGRARLRSCGRV